jgi:molybdopterin-containing oxidoreductase family iron-sulfur binding subunit
VETHLGRPTKVEGNPDHPASLGGTSVRAQASILDLYDPDRAREVTYLEEPRSWDEFLVALRGAVEPLRTRGGAGLHILTGTVNSPSLGAQLAAVTKALPAAEWHQHEPAGCYSARAGAQLAFGRPLHVHYRLDQADVVLSLDSDFLACGPDSTRMAHDFADRRRKGRRLDMNRLYVVESSVTSTGGKADHRLPVRYPEIESFAFEPR